MPDIEETIVVTSTTEVPLQSKMSSKKKDKKLNKEEEKLKARYPGIELPESDQVGLKKFRSRAKLLDSNFQVCGIRFGIDPIIGLIPGIGDAITAFLSAMIVFRVGRHCHLPTSIILHMYFNVLIDAVGGVLPLVGDIFDLIFKCNIRNLKLLEEFLYVRAKKESKKAGASDGGGGGGGGGTRGYGADAAAV